MLPVCLLLGFECSTLPSFRPLVFHIGTCVRARTRCHLYLLPLRAGFLRFLSSGYGMKRFHVDDLPEDLQRRLRLERRHLMSRIVNASERSQDPVSGPSTIDKKGTKSGTHANEKLSTFLYAATTSPSIVMFVKGVVRSSARPCQSIASTHSCPPTQLQLFRAPSVASSWRGGGWGSSTHLMSASPA